MADPKLGQMQQKILDLLKAHPEGISEGEMKAALALNADEQGQFGRRRRDLHPFFEIDKRRIGHKTIYILRGERKSPLDSVPIDTKTRALVLKTARGRCGMCGRTVEKHRITLVVDHKLPRDWGGATDLENLWAICEECNHGKKNLFATVDSEPMRNAVAHTSVHVRIGELLKALGQQAPVPNYLIEFVANQDDWKKRLRELRYLGWKIESSRKREKTGRVRSSYRLLRFTEWPDNPSDWIRRYEEERAKKNRSRR